MKKTFFLASLLFLIPSLSFAQSVDILWEGETYTPPFYEGLPLWSYQSEITFTAIAMGFGEPEKLSYTWIRNGTVLGLVSGVGKNSLSFMDTVFSKPVRIEVEVKSPRGELARNRITTSPQDASVLIYENNPLYGFLFNQEASNNYKLRENEVTFSAFPHFFSTFSKDEPGLLYKWGSGVGSVGNSATYRSPENQSGRSRILISVTSESFLKQRANSDFLVQFGEE